MSKHSKKGFRKLENHELSEFATLHGEDSGSDSEMIEMERENGSRRGGGLCCWCVGLYLILLTCFIILLCMFGIYFGYNMMRVSSDYSQRIRSLEGKVDELEKSLSAAKTLSESLMYNMSQRVGVVNDSVLKLARRVDTHTGKVQGSLGAVEESVDDLKKRVSAFESHPPTIGEDEVTDMRSSMAEFRSHLESYDAQLSEVKKSAGDATHDVSKVDERLQLLRKNVTSLKSGLSTAQKDHMDTVDNLDLLRTQFSALQVVVQDINETVLHEAQLSMDAINKTRSELSDVTDQLTDLVAQLDTLNHDVEHLNSSMAETPPTTELPTSGMEMSSNPTESTAANTEPPTTLPTITTVTTQPATVTTQPATGTTQPATGTTQPATVTTQPATGTTQPATGTTQPATVTTQPATVTTTEADTEMTTEPTTEATVPTTQSSEVTTPTEDEPTTEATTIPDSGASMSSNGEMSENTTASDTVTPTALTENNDINEEGLTPSSPLSSPSGIPSDSTEATEDLPGSESSPDSPSLSSSGQGQTGNNVPEDQPPTIDDRQKSLQDTISKLQELLTQFFMLDNDADSALDYFEFTAFAGGTESSQRIFQAMDVDQDNVITYQEVSDTILMLERQTTEGTEDVPGKSQSESTDQYKKEGAPGTETLPTTEATETEYDAISSSSETTGPAHEAVTGSESTETTATHEPGPGTTASASLVNDTDSRTGANEGKDRILQAWKTLSAILEKFYLLDTNHDNRLSSFEFAEYFPAENNEVVTSIFSYLDKNGDFFVSHQEIVTAIEGLEHEMPLEKEDETADPEGELADYLHSPDTNF